MIYEKVLKFLTEKNINVLSKIDEDENGNLLFGGASVSSGDSMQKSIYDKDDDGIVDLAKSIKDLTSTVEFLNSLPNEIVNIKEIINTPVDSQLKVVDRTDQLPTTSKDDTLYIVIDDITVNGICLYLGKNTQYINLFENIGIGSGGTSSGKPLVQSVKLNAVAGQKYTTFLPIDKKRNDIIIQCLKFIPGQNDIVEILKEFSDGDNLNFSYNKDNVIFDADMKIKTKYQINSILTPNGNYETDLIDVDEFVNILSII